MSAWGAEDRRQSLGFAKDTETLRGNPYIELAVISVLG